MQDIPSEFSLVSEAVHNRIAACLEGVDTPRFVAFYVISSGAVAMNTGHTIDTFADTDGQLRACLLQAMAGEANVVVVDREQKSAWRASYSTAVSYLAIKNPPK